MNNALENMCTPDQGTFPVLLDEDNGAKLVFCSYVCAVVSCAFQDQYISEHTVVVAALVLLSRVNECESSMKF